MLLLGGDVGGDGGGLPGQLRDAEPGRKAIDGSDERVQELRGELAARLRIVDGVAGDVGGHERADEQGRIAHLHRKGAVGVHLQVGAVEEIVVGQRPARAEADAADLAQVHERDALVVGGDAAEGEALGGLAEQRFPDAHVRAVLRVEHRGLAVAVLVAAGRGDDLLDAGLAEHERGAGLI